MKIIISPAKKMNIDTDSFDIRGLPYFIDEAETIKNSLKLLDSTSLKKLWACNDNIVSLNIDRLKDMDLHKKLTPAILAYEGIQYKYMAPGVFEYKELDYITEHLRILSGFYGILKPFDGVVPYRLEMQAKLNIDNYKDLYSFWGDKLAKNLAAETDVILNLASKEYSVAISRYLTEKTLFLNCTFGEIIKDKVVEKGTICKMARGAMVRFLAEQNIREIEDIKKFNLLGYSFSEKLSSEDNFVFIRGGKSHDFDW